jgi:uncharacterized protein (DUF1330 family)
MAKAYVVFTEDVHDPEKMKSYSRLAIPTLAQGGATVLVASDQPDVLEGAWPGKRTVILEFESVDAARDWYTSPDYQAAASLRQAAAHCSGVILPGVGSQ